MTNKLMLLRNSMMMIMTITILARGKLTYYDEINDQLHDTTKDVINKAFDISAEVDDFKEDKKA